MQTLSGKKNAGYSGGGPSALLQRFLEGKTVREARADLLVVPQPEDVKGATRNDPSNCVFARACARAYGSSKVLFLGTVAYVELMDEDGAPVVERFSLSNAAKRYIKDFDDEKPVGPGGFRMIAPSGSATLNGRMEANRKHKQAVIKGNFKPGPTSSNKPRPWKKPVVTRMHALRNYSGLVHFRKEV